MVAGAEAEVIKGDQAIREEQLGAIRLAGEQLGGNQASRQRQLGGNQAGRQRIEGLCSLEKGPLHSQQGKRPDHEEAKAERPSLSLSLKAERREDQDAISNYIVSAEKDKSDQELKDQAWFCSVHEWTLCQHQAGPALRPQPSSQSSAS
ncbi:hypothetical protein D623_10031251 [Myotis brandtii]|uniref:Uncharacterized protein n=1 Tax=Myotis brandtii TaxID=109478 RepID=S7PQI6_MYOBR|nr:hypothetical protein D623_10031251 [Myotis brandtii]